MDNIACAFVIIAVLVCAALICCIAPPGAAENFLPSTFQLGSYDPSRYASDITRRP